MWGRSKRESTNNWWIDLVLVLDLKSRYNEARSKSSKSSAKLLRKLLSSAWTISEQRKTVGRRNGSNHGFVKWFQNVQCWDAFVKIPDPNKSPVEPAFSCKFGGTATLPGPKVRSFVVNNSPTELLRHHQPGYDWMRSQWKLNWMKHLPTCFSSIRVRVPACQAYLEKIWKTADLFERKPSRFSLERLWSLITVEQNDRQPMVGPILKISLGIHVICVIKTIK